MIEDKVNCGEDEGWKRLYELIRQKKRPTFNTSKTMRMIVIYGSVKWVELVVGHNTIAEGIRMRDHLLLERLSSPA